MADEGEAATGLLVEETDKLAKVVKQLEDAQQEVTLSTMSHTLSTRTLPLTLHNVSHTLHTPSLSHYPQCRQLEDSEREVRDHLTQCFYESVLESQLPHKIVNILSIITYRNSRMVSDTERQVYLTKSFFNVVLQKSTPPQIRQLIRYYY